MTSSALMPDSDSRQVKRPWILEKSTLVPAILTTSSMASWLVTTTQTMPCALEPSSSTMVCRLSMRATSRPLFTYWPTSSTMKSSRNAPGHCSARLRA